MLRKFASVNLAPWHNLKHGVELIWKYFAQEVFAPMCRCLYPQNKFAIKYQSPQEPLLHIMLLCHVYPEFKPNLQAGITQAGATKVCVCSATSSSLSSLRSQWYIHTCFFDVVERVSLERHFLCSLNLSRERPCLF